MPTTSRAYKGKEVAGASLGTDLPLNVVDGYRQAVHAENQRRMGAVTFELAPSESKEPQLCQG